MASPSFVISVQSQVVYGHVGNSAGVLPMQLAGINVAAVPTTLLSNHPGFPSLYGHVLDAALVADLLRGVEDRGVIARSFAIVSGYLGSGEIGAALGDFVARARTINPAIRYICDPVMGDVHTGTYVRVEAVDVLRQRLCPMADLLTPNQYELGLLTDRAITRWSDVLAAAEQLRGVRGAQLVVTSCILEDTPPDTLENIVFDGDVPVRLPIARQPVTLQGTGDLFTGALTAALFRGRSLRDAAGDAAAMVSNVARQTLLAGGEHGEMEMQLGSVIDLLRPADSAS